MSGIDFNRWLTRLRISGTNALLILAALVGIATALGAIGFTALIRFANHIFFGMTDEYLTHFGGGGVFKWWLPLIPMLGGLCVGPIVHYFASEARGHGVTEVINAVARLGGIIRPRVAVVKTVASAICIGSGGSAGREGPIVQIGSAIGSTFGQFFGMSGERVRVLVGCGAAAGISSVFNAPIAGVLFSLEVILGDFAIRTFSPVLISSVIASVLTRSILGNYPAFEVTPYELDSAWEIIIYSIMGAALGAVAVLFTKTLHKTEGLFERLKINSLIKPGIGGLLLGGIAIFYPQVLADGYETITLTLNGDMAFALLVPLIFLKIIGTSLTLGSGSSGGVFAPSLFIGAVAGGAFGMVANWLFPGGVGHPGAYALVGMAGLVAGTTHAPMTAILIIFEITNDYHIILPLMMTVTFATLTARSMLPHSIYTFKLFQRGIEIRGGRDINVLRAYKVQDVMRTQFETMTASTTLGEIFARFEQSNENYFVVIDGESRLIGVLAIEDVRALITRRTVDQLIVAQDIIRAHPSALKPDDDLESATKAFALRDTRLLPVVDQGDARRVVGVLARDDLTNFYNRRLVELMRQ